MDRKELKRIREVYGLSKSQLVGFEAMYNLGVQLGYEHDYVCKYAAFFVKNVKIIQQKWYLDFFDNPLENYQ